MDFSFSAALLATPMNKTTDGCLVLAPGLLSASISAQDPHAADNLCRLLGFAEQIECPNDELLSLESLVSKYLLPTVESSCAAVFTYGKDFKPGAEDQSLAVLRAVNYYSCQCRDWSRCYREPTGGHRCTMVAKQACRNRNVVV